MKLSKIVVQSIAYFSVQNFKVSVESWKSYVVGMGTQNPGFGYPKYHGELGLRQI